MISTKNLISDLKDVPREWVFEYYLNLKEKLTGQDIKILSAFNSKDKVPSMCIYHDLNTGFYKFKDFSSGNQGDSIELVKALFNMPTRGHATNKILSDYQEYVSNNTNLEQREFKIHDKFKVVDFEIRHWNTLDQQYWMRYKIGSKLLEHYNVRPLKYFTMEKKDLDDTLVSFKFERPYMYGYFRNDGALYKIYMPKNIDKKFIKAQNYVQGIDQLTFEKDYLVITSSLKDLMAFQKLQIVNAESIAPDSENTMIGEVIMNKLSKKYKSVIVLFDNDAPGIKAAERYKVKYGFNYVTLIMEKDLSDSIEKHGVDKTRGMLLPLLKQAL
jgi:hypothetical protein